MHKRKRTLFCSEYMLEKFNKADQVNYKKSHDLQVLYIKNGIIHPQELSETNEKENNQYGGVTDENLNFIELSLPKRFQGDCTVKYHQWYIGANPNIQTEDIEYIDEDVVFIGPIKSYISHFYLETFCRCWFFLNENNLKYKIAFLSNEGEPPNYEYVCQFLDGLGINQDSLIEIKKPTKFRTVIVPEQAYELNKCYHPIYKDLFDKIKEKIEPAPYKKVYFSKKFNFEQNPRITGDELAQEIFEANGFTVFHPERMSITEMLSILKGCEEFAAQSGSNAHNAIFLNDFTKLIVLNRSEHVHPTQTMIDEMRQLQTIYVDVCDTILPVNWDVGPFVFQYTKHLEDYLDTYNMKFDKEKLKEQSQKNLSKFVDTYIYWLSIPFFYNRLPKKEISIQNFINIVSKLNKKSNPPEEDTVLERTSS